ncbi:hypothetical protein AQUCO_09600051v1 [Aquilegia coerulea]|uniref:Calmodulin-binding domain-containing protein n=1 Tax=Aquilegia coerulea TaxID=218851 RepID=A0A2G5C4L4_AQUCA|nr:hypothetical protein AQUCO_09600051v1 [Aquilegia coerulea]
MATTAKDTSQGKEKTKASSSTTQKNDTTQARKTPRPFIAGSSSRGLAILTDKPSPHYLKPTLSSTKDASKLGKKLASDDTSLKYSHGRRKSTDRPLSPPKLKRTLSGNSRGRPIKTPSPPPKKCVSPKPVVDRASKTPKNGKPQPFTKPISIKKNASSLSVRPKRETKSTTSSTTRSATPTPTAVTPPSPNTIETALVKSDEEEKATPVQETPTEAVKEDGIQVENTAANDQTSIDPTDTGLQKSDSCDSSILSEEHELLAKAPTADHEERSEVADTENKPKDEEQSKTNEDNSIVPDESKPQTEAEAVENEGEIGDGETSEKTEENKDVVTSTEDAGEEDKPHKLKFQQGKQLEEKEVEDTGNLQRLKFKERKEEQGKKESPAYNDVIEETASKLVGKRKSKVKALVGAFETVINLENDTQQNEGE